MTPPDPPPHGAPPAAALLAPADASGAEPSPYGPAEAWTGGAAAEPPSAASPPAPPTPRWDREDTRRAWGWVRVLGGAVAFALLLRVFAFEAYRIPSTSMEETLLVGDLVFVSKLHYGPRILGRRLPGVTDVAVGDVVVFNYPPGLEPEVERRTPYIKRVVGTGGDAVSLAGKRLLVNGAPLAFPTHGRRLWRVDLDGTRTPSAEALAAIGLSGDLIRLDPTTRLVGATEAEAMALSALGGVAGVAPFVRPPGDGSASFPAALRYSLDDYGPVTVPKAGLTVPLDDTTWAVYRATIERFEGRTAERTADGFVIDGRPTATYTFGQDYLFVLGDNRDDSADSRTWGFVPMSHLIGKAVLVYFSWDEVTGRPRFGRVGPLAE